MNLPDGIISAVILLAMTILQWIHRSQVKLLLQDASNAAALALEKHNANPDAHNNHKRVEDLENKFTAVVEKVGLLTTEVAVLNERLKTLLAQRKR